jgi:hypothetical protein
MNISRALGTGVHRNGITNFGWSPPLQNMKVLRNTQQRVISLRPHNDTTQWPANECWWYMSDTQVPMTDANRHHQTWRVYYGDADGGNI